MRGAPIPSRNIWVMKWIIPADAGSTQRARLDAKRRKVHPRGCGEHPNIWFALVIILGSSPRMRGALPTKVSVLGEKRIIPADAGSTTHQGERTRGKEDHPRGCGEHFAKWFIDSTESGSSPRMRGAHTITQSVSGLSRIIPADAGSKPPAAGSST